MSDISKQLLGAVKRCRGILDQYASHHLAKPDYDKAAANERHRAICAEAIAAAEQAQQAEPVAWKHDCAALLMNDVELWVRNCPHCGKPRAAQPPDVAAPEHNLSDVRCGCCGYMTYHREHMGCIRAAQKGGA